MNREEKAAVIDQVANEIQQSQAIFAVDYRGISVKQAKELRGALSEADASFQIVKNTLTERAADKAGAESLKSLLAGPTALTFVRGDAAMAAKALAGFRRQAGLLEFKGGQLGDQTLSIEQIEDIARLPARDVLRGQFVGVLASPITGLVRGLGSLIGGLAVALGQIQEQGLVGGHAPAAPEPETTSPSEAPGDPAADAEADAAAGPASADTSAEGAPDERQGGSVAEAEAAADESASEPAPEGAPEERPGETSEKQEG